VEIGTDGFWSWQFMHREAEKGLILFPEGREGREWSHVADELSKVSSCFKAKTGSLSSGSPPTVVLSQVCALAMEEASSKFSDTQ
jgi:hypothetical protein